MNKFLLSLVLIAVGAILVYQGKERADSLAGRSESLGKDLANAVDGKSRMPEHTAYYIGGGALILFGLGSALRNRPGK